MVTVTLGRMSKCLPAVRALILTRPVGQFPWHAPVNMRFLSTTTPISPKATAGHDIRTISSPPEALATAYAIVRHGWVFTSQSFTSFPIGATGFTYSWAA